MVAYPTFSLLPADLPSLLSLSPRQVLPTERELKDFQSKIIPRVARKIESDRDKVLQFVDPLSKYREKPYVLCICKSVWVGDSTIDLAHPKVNRSVGHQRMNESVSHPRMN